MLTGSALLSLLLFCTIQPLPDAFLPALVRHPRPRPAVALLLLFLRNALQRNRATAEHSNCSALAAPPGPARARTHTRTHLRARARTHTHTHTHTALLPDMEEVVTKGPRTRAAGAAPETPRSALACALDERVCTHLVRLLVLCHRAGREAAEDGAAMEPVWLHARVCRIRTRVCLCVCVGE